MTLVDALSNAPVRSKRKVDQLLAIVTPEEAEAVLAALHNTEEWDADALAKVLTQQTPVKVSGSSVRRYREDVLGLDK